MQEETELQKRLKIYKLNDAKKFKIIKYSLSILQFVKVLFFGQFYIRTLFLNWLLKAQIVEKVYNFLMFKKIDTVLLRIFVFIIANFILFCLLLL